MAGRSVGHAWDGSACGAGKGTVDGDATCMMLPLPWGEVLLEGAVRVGCSACSSDA